MISFVEIVECLEDTRVDIRPEAPPLHSRPSYSDLFPLVVNSIGRSGRSRGTPTIQA